MLTPKQAILDLLDACGGQDFDRCRYEVLEQVAGVTNTLASAVTQIAIDDLIREGKIVVNDDDIILYFDLPDYTELQKEMATCLIVEALWGSSGLEDEQTRLEIGLPDEAWDEIKPPPKSELFEHNAWMFRWLGLSLERESQLAIRKAIDIENAYNQQWKGSLTLEQFYELFGGEVPYRAVYGAMGHGIGLWDNGGIAGSDTEYIESLGLDAGCKISFESFDVYDLLRTIAAMWHSKAAIVRHELRGQL